MENLCLDVMPFHVNDMKNMAKYLTRIWISRYEVYDYENGPIRCYIEVKAQRRSFMSVSKFFLKVI